MTLIICPEWGKEISDRVKACPNCGYPFEEVIEKGENGENIEEKFVNRQQRDSSNKLKILVGIGAIVIIAVIALVAFFITININEKSAFNTYIDNLNLISTMLIEEVAGAVSLSRRRTPARSAVMEK